MKGKAKYRQQRRQNDRTKQVLVLRAGMTRIQLKHIHPFRILNESHEDLVEIEK